jgi:hypothetical protein
MKNNTAFAVIAMVGLAVVLPTQAQAATDLFLTWPGIVGPSTDEDIFRGVCQMGLEGVVSKRLSSAYRSGRSTDWLKIKNPNSPAMVRHREGDW